MDFFDGKVVIVTGASQGIGAKLAEILNKRGARTVLAARSEEKLAEAAGANSLICAGDLTRDAARAAVIEKTLIRFGRIDILINNAGRGSYYPATAAPVDDARTLFELNFFAPLALAQLAAPHLRESRGSLVNVSSIAGMIALPWLPVYSASKFALASLTSSQRVELRKAGVHVMGVFPGYVKTEFQAHASGARPPDRVAEGKRFAVSSGECAEAILKGIENRSHTVVTPRTGWPLIWLNRLLPGFMESRLGTV